MRLVALCGAWGVDCKSILSLITGHVTSRARRRAQRDGLTGGARTVPPWAGSLAAGSRKTVNFPGRSDGPAMEIDRKEVETHLQTFVATQRGVEAYVEPRDECHDDDDRADRPRRRVDPAGRALAQEAFEVAARSASPSTTSTRPATPPGCVSGASASAAATPDPRRLACMPGG